MPSPQRRPKERADVLSATDEFELSLLVHDRTDAGRARLAEMWLRHGAALVERDGPDRWQMPLQFFGEPPTHKEHE